MSRRRIANYSVPCVYSSQSNRIVFHQFTYMAWSSLPPRKRAVIRGVIFFVVVIAISIVWNVADPHVAHLLRLQDLWMAIAGTGIYVLLMWLVERGVISRKNREPGPR